MSKDEAMKLALEALLAATPVKAKDPQMQAVAIVALQEALAEPQQEPVAWADALFDAIKHGDEDHQNWLQEKLKSWVIVNPPPTPPAAQRPWVGLTDEQIDLFINGRGDEDDDDYVEPTGDGYGLTDSDLMKLVRRSEAKLKEKNT
jgi:hypothetical protein